MVGKHDLQNPGGDLGLSPRRSPLDLSSGLLETVPSPGIAFGWLRMSNVKIINDTEVDDIHLPFAYSMSAS